MKVSVIIVSYNVAHFLELCLSSVRGAMAGIEAEIIVVDNASGDDSVLLVQQQFPEVVLLVNKDNTGFSKANNQAAAISKGEYLLFLNPDTVMPENFLHTTLAYMDAHPTAGALGPRLIDGAGRFAPDSKKSFPTLPVAIYKAIGLNKIFPRSHRFNAYYAVHIPERKTSPVAVLSGCCMLVRRTAMNAAGGAFDEAYFMYCEDVDLCYRIAKAGYENIYFPLVDLIHFKGESTRKATFSYVRIFNEALATFVRKHFSAGHKRIFLLFLQAGIFVRALLALARNVFRAIRLPLFDALALLVVLFIFRDFWVAQVKNQNPVPAQYVLATFPAYLLLWISALYLNGAYDKPYRPLRVVRGMVIGSVLILAYFGLLPAALRYSRGVIVLSGITGTVALLALHELLNATGIHRLVRTDEAANKSVIVGPPGSYASTSALLRQMITTPHIQGRICPAAENDSDFLSGMEQLPQFLKSSAINEVIFCAGAVPYQLILQTMQRCGPACEYRFHVSGSNSIVGSHTSLTAGGAYSTGEPYAIGSFAQQRNKKLLDIVLAVALIIAFPALAMIVKQPKSFFRNILKVLAGRTTWVGYIPIANPGLPVLKPAVLPPWNIVEDYHPAASAMRQSAINYAGHYTPGRDLKLVWDNLKFLGRQPDSFSV